MTRELPVHQPPMYCTTCGRQLVDDLRTIGMGFDALTGKPNPARDHVTRRCPSGGDDTWVLVDSGTPSAKWVRP